MPKLLKPPKFENVDDTTFDHYASAGMLAGEKAGSSLRHGASRIPARIL
jgi:hypothetical protein